MRLARSLSLLLLPLAALGARTAQAADDHRDSREWNYVVEIPPGWKWDNPSPSWDKDGVRVGASHPLEKLDNGKPGQGEGAEMRLSVLPVPEGKTLGDLAADKSQREFLTRLVGKLEGEPKVEDETVKNEEQSSEVPAVLLTVKGTGINRAGNESPCVGLMLFTIARKRLYRLRLVAYTTTHDDEGLKSDLDAIEMNFMIPDLTKEKVKEERPKDDDPGGNGKPGVKGDDDASKEYPIGNPLQGWTAKKPKRLTNKPIDPATAPANLQFEMEAADQGGSVNVRMFAYQADSTTQRPLVLIDFMGTTWWKEILAAFSAGDLVTYPFPRAKPNGTFLTVPDVDKPEPLPEAMKRVPDLTSSDIVKKLGFVEEVKKASLNPQGKPPLTEIWRGNIRGNRERVGPELQLRFAWKTTKYEFTLTVVFGREGIKKYGPPVKELLESIALVPVK